MSMGNKFDMLFENCCEIEPTLNFKFEKKKFCYQFLRLVNYNNKVTNNSLYNEIVMIRKHS